MGAGILMLPGDELTFDHFTRLYNPSDGSNKERRRINSSWLTGLACGMCQQFGQTERVFCFLTCISLAGVSLATNSGLVPPEERLKIRSY